MPENTNKLKNKNLRINEVLEKLRKKMLFFSVINFQGEMLGRIGDFYIDKNRHLNLVIDQAEANSDSSRLLLSSKSIQKVDTENRLVIVDLSQEELYSLPDYQLPAKSSGIHLTSETLDSEALASEGFSESDETSEVVEEEIIRLLEERLVVNHSKQKIGEVVVRKEIETRMVEVPVRREKLIIEQVGAETKQLAEIDLGKGEVKGVEQRSVSSYAQGYTVKGEFVSPRAVSDLLDAIALHDQHGCTQIRVELVVNSQELQETYQKMFDNCSHR